MTEKTERQPLTIPQKLDLMLAVRDTYTGSDMTDTEFARKCGDALGRAIHPSTITSYREAFGIPAYKAPTQAELRAKLRELQAKLDLRDAEPVT